MKLHAEVATVDSRQVCWFSKVGSRYNLRCGQQNSGRHILGATICRQHIIASLDIGCLMTCALMIFV